MTSLREQVRTYSNPTLEEVIAQQHASQPRHLPILPRPTTEPLPAELSSRARNPTRKATKSTVDSKVKQHLNKCPLQGTSEARLRTIEASLKRCSSHKKRLEFLAKRGIKWEDWQLERAKREVNTAKKPRSRARPNATTKGEVLMPRAPMQLPPLQPKRRGKALQRAENLLPLREVLSSLWGPGGQAWMQDDRLYVKLHADAEDINQYYTGRGRPHLFCIIARFKNVEEPYDRSEELDYLCCSAARHYNLNGNEALQLTTSILSALEDNVGPVRCDLQKCHNLYQQTRTWPRFMFLESILKSCCVSLSMEEPQLLSGGQLGFSDAGMQLHSKSD